MNKELIKKIKKIYCDLLNQIDYEIYRKDENDLYCIIDIDDSMDLLQFIDETIDMTID